MTGFTDVAPVVREQTLKSVLVLINKLSDRTVNGELLRYLAKTANDDQPGIRTNTTICLGKIAKNLGTSTRAKVLIAAFTRSLRDPFVHARNASLLALSATSEHFSDEDCAARIIPSISPLLIDKEKLIRDQANKAIEVYLQKIRKAAAAMADTALPPESASSGNPRMSTPQPAESSASAASAWAGWAISSFTNKLSAAAGEIESNGASTPAAALAPASKPARPATSQTASTLHRQALKSPTPSSAPLSRTSSSGGMAGGEGSFFADPDVGDDDGDAWGDMDDNNDNTAADLFGGDDNTQSFSRPSAAGGGGGTAGSSRTVSGPWGATPFDDGAEPDFAGWLAAQAQKKSAIGGGGKTLPKGLGKAAAKPAAAAAKKTLPISKKPAPAKKIDMKPKESGDDDGWGDGW